MPKDFAKLERPQDPAAAKPQNQNIPIWVWLVGALLIGNIAVFIGLYNKKLDASQAPAAAEQAPAPVTLEDVFSPDEMEPIGTSTASVTVTEESGSIVTSSETTQAQANTAMNTAANTTPGTAPRTYDFYQKLPEVDVLGDISTDVGTTLPQRVPKRETPSPSQNKATTASNTAPAANTTSQAAEPRATTPKPVEVPKRLVNKGYLLQVASFKSELDAQRLQARLQKAGFASTYIQEAEVKNATWHRVMVGEFSDYNTMNSKRQGLKLLGFDSMLITLKR